MTQLPSADHLVKTVRLSGLTVIENPIPAGGKTTVKVTVRAGSSAQAGFPNTTAHFLEHVLCGGTLKHTNNELNKLKSDNAIETNAGTSYTYTMYYTTCLNRYTPLMLDLIGNSLSIPAFDPKYFENEREIIRQEMTSLYSSPTDKLWETAFTQSFSPVSTVRSPIGSEDDLDKTTLDDLKRFYDTFYRPSNMAVTISGTWDPADLETFCMKLESHLEGHNTSSHR